MSKKRLKVFVLAALVIGLTIPVVFAYMFKQDSTENNTFITADIFTTNPVIEEVVNQNIDGKNVTVKKSIKIQNTGNIESYIRVKLITYWEDSKGNIVGKASEDLDFATTDDWIYDAKNDVYYYKYPINPGETTHEFLKSGSTIQLEHLEETVIYQSVTITYEYNQVVEIHVEGIQANPSNVVSDIWKVNIDTNRTIISVNK